MSRRPTMSRRLESAIVGHARWLDDRLTTSRFAKTMMNKIFPDHWSFLLGEIALYSFVVLLVTGVFLTLYFIPSSREIVYHGSYAPLRGTRVSEAYASTVDLSFSVRAGLVMRQMHHWACDVFVAAIVIHMCRIFFTGAFRRPREINWGIGVTLLTLAIVNGFIGYSLPDDLVSGTGLRIAFSIILSIPVVGSYLAFFIFGGNFPGDSIIPRFFTIHVLILPAIIVALLTAHLFLLVHQKHTQFPGRGRTNRNVVGSPFFPNFIFKSTGLFMMVTAGLAALGGLAQINPIWLYGSYVPWKVSYAVQPDWYMGWLDGALRIMPSWETAAAGHTIPWVVFAPAVILPGLTFGLLYVWPFIEGRFTKDRAEHHLLDQPRNRPKRTAVGAAALSFYFVLFGASSTDVLANYFHISLNLVLWAFRVLVFVVPPIVGFVAYRICLELQGSEQAGKRKRSNIIMRSAGGGYTTRPAEARPGDEQVELEPERIPSEAAERAPAMVGGGGDSPDGGGVGAAEAAGTPRSRSGIFRVPRRS